MVKKIGLVWPYCPALKSTRLFHTHGHFLMSLNNCRQFWPSIIVIRPKGQKAKGAYASNSFHVFVLRPWETKVQEFSLYKNHVEVRQSRAKYDFTCSLLQHQSKINRYLP
ncbi:hypothetical protein O6H91_23G008500 [Diphasiastrum complanatum]|uniref:Uncharacterized protein n=1 Tax=Diphasiastrum complanatum TaxID=34168 RepID=A0ACC2A842_DIPCM|nr:hypothetical protein O6H91_23G008500 [Diphasiastrum complanatum]